MELSDSSIIKILYIFGKRKSRKKVLIFQETKTLKTSYISGNKTFQTKLGKIKILFGKMELSNSNIKKFLTLSEEKAVHIFQETGSPKKFLILQKTELSYISGSNFPSSKKRKNPL